MVHERLRKTVNSWQIPNVTSRGVQTVAGGGDPSKKPKKAVKPHWNRANSVMNRGGTRADRTAAAAVTAGANARPQTAPSKVGFGGSYRPAPASRRPAGSAVVSASSTTTSTSAASPSLARSRRASTETSALLKRSVTPLPPTPPPLHASASASPTPLVYRQHVPEGTDQRYADICSPSKVLSRRGPALLPTRLPARPPSKGILLLLRMLTSAR